MATKEVALKRGGLDNISRTSDGRVVILTIGWGSGKKDSKEIPEVGIRERDPIDTSCLNELTRCPVGFKQAAGDPPDYTEQVCQPKSS